MNIRHYGHLLQVCENTELEEQCKRESWGHYEQKAHDMSRVCRGRSFNKVMDVGCGIGVVMDEFSRSMGIVTNSIIGSDLSFNILKYAKNKSPEVSFICADIQNLPLKDKVIDLIVCSDVIEHVPDFEKAFREISRVSNYACLKIPLEDCLILNVRDKLLRRRPEVGHINRFNLKLLLSIFSSNDYQVENFQLKSLPLRYGWKVSTSLRSRIYFVAATIFVHIIPRSIFTKFFGTMQLYALLKCQDLSK